VLRALERRDRPKRQRGGAVTSRYRRGTIRRTRRRLGRDGLFGDWRVRRGAVDAVAPLSRSASVNDASAAAFLDGTPPTGARRQDERASATTAAS
jgi:hypothetical protein